MYSAGFLVTRGRGEDEEDERCRRRALHTAWMWDVMEGTTAGR